MKKFLFFLIIIITYGCNKPKTVLICGDHVCVNKAEAEQYFEENLTLEVKIIDKKKPKEVNLVQINLESNKQGKKEVSIYNKKQTSKKLKDLTDLEIKEKKFEVKKRNKDKNKETKKIKQAKLKKVKEKKKNQKITTETKKVVNKTINKTTDICTILEKCSIDEISKYLVKQGKEKKFPDITTREN